MLQESGKCEQETHHCLHVLNYRSFGLITSSVPYQISANASKESALKVA